MVCVFSHYIFSSASETWNHYGSVLSHSTLHVIWVVMNNATHNHWKCFIKLVTWTCWGFYWSICTLPQCSTPLGIVHISIKPLTALSYINVHIHLCTAETWLSEFPLSEPSVIQMLFQILKPQKIIWFSAKPSKK